MILTKELEIKVNPRLVKYYQDLGYNIKGCEIIKIPVEHLPKGSSVKINVKCDVCDNKKELSYKSYINNISKYPLYACSEKCSNIKREMTCMEKYGVKYNKDRENFKEKSQKTKLEKYGDINYTNRDKYKNTCLEKYGVINVFCDKNIIKKSEETKLERYGTKNFYNIDKILNTKMEKYGDPYFNNIEKAKNTCLEKYGVDSFSKLETSKKMTSLNTKRWYDENPNERIKRKEWMSSELFREKSIKTCLEKYGVKSVMHIDSVVLKNHLSGMLCNKFNNTDLYYRGSYELDFLEKYSDKIVIENFGGIDYFLKNKKSKYFPDFYIRDLNLIIEIKSKYTYEIDIEKNIEKQKATKLLGYNHIFIIDKNYDELDFIINKI